MRSESDQVRNSRAQIWKNKRLYLPILAIEKHFWSSLNRFQVCYKITKLRARKRWRSIFAGNNIWKETTFGNYCEVNRYSEIILKISSTNLTFVLTAFWMMKNWARSTRASCQFQLTRLAFYSDSVYEFLTAPVNSNQNGISFPSSTIDSCSTFVDFRLASMIRTRIEYVFTRNVKTAKWSLRECFHLCFENTKSDHEFGRLIEVIRLLEADGARFWRCSLLEWIILTLFVPCAKFSKCRDSYSRITYSRVRWSDCALFGFISIWAGVITSHTHSSQFRTDKAHNGQIRAVGGDEFPPSENEISTAVKVNTSITSKPLNPSILNTCSFEFPFCKFKMN